MRRVIVKILIQLGHLGSLECGLAIPVSEKADHTAWVNDLVRWAQRHVQETRNRDRWDEVAVRECVARIVNLFKGIRSQIEMLLWSNDVNILAVVNNFADEWNVLQAEQCDLTLEHALGATERVLGLPVESTLSED